MAPYRVVPRALGDDVVRAVMRRLLETALLLAS